MTAKAELQEQENISAMSLEAPVISQVFGSPTVPDTNQLHMCCDPQSQKAHNLSLWCFASIGWSACDEDMLPVAPHSGLS